MMDCPISKLIERIKLYFPLVKVFCLSISIIFPFPRGENSISSLIWKLSVLGLFADLRTGANKKSSLSLNWIY